MTKAWTEYIGSLREQVALMSEALALSKESVSDSISMLKVATSQLMMLLRKHESQPVIANLFKEMSELIGTGEVGVIAVDPNGKCLYANGVAERVLAHQAGGPDNPTKVDSGFYLADKVTACGENSPLLRSAQGQDVMGAQIYVVNPAAPDGVWLTINSLCVKDRNATAAGAIALFVDITEFVHTESHIDGNRRSLEQRLVFTTSAHNDLSVLADKLGKQNWGDAEFAEEIVLAAAESLGENGKLALIADDILVHHALLTSHLAKLGFTVHSANNGQEALEAVSKVDYSLILMDCDMPMMDGYEATRKIREAQSASNKRTPIIAMTGYDRAGDRAKCLEAGMDEYLTKSSDLRQLAKVIDAVMTGEGAQEDANAASSGETDMSGKQSQLDLRSLADSFGEERYREIVILFLRTSITLTECLRASLSDRDVRSVHHYAYCIKGPAASLGQTEMADLCRQIAESALRNKWFDADDAFYSLETALKKIKKTTAHDLGLNEDIGLIPAADLPTATSTLPTFAKLEKQLGKKTTLALANAFLQDEEGVLAAIGASLDSKDGEQVKKLLHKISGCCASIQDKESQHICKMLQIAVDSKNWNSCTNHFLDLSNSLGRTRTQSKEYIKRTSQEG